MARKVAKKVKAAKKAAPRKAVKKAAKSKPAGNGFFKAALAKADPQVAASIKRELGRQHRRLRLIDIAAQRGSQRKQIVSSANDPPRRLVPLDDRRRPQTGIQGKLAEPRDLLPALAAAAEPFQLSRLSPVGRRIGRRGQLDGGIGVPVE